MLYTMYAIYEYLTCRVFQSDNSAVLKQFHAGNRPSQRLEVKLQNSLVSSFFREATDFNLPTQTSWCCSHGICWRVVGNLLWAWNKLMKTYHTINEMVII